MSAKNRIDETGKIFSKLTVLYYVENYVHQRRGRFAAWKVRCECGKEKVVLGIHLRSGKTKSCGCLMGQGPWKHYKKGQAARNYVINYYKYSAEKKNLIWNLTDEQFDDIVLSNCHYCGEKPSKISKTAKGTFTYNGVDRKNNLQGYTLDNSLPCCEICNLAKRDLSYEEFVSWLKKAGRHQNGELQFLIS